MFEYGPRSKRELKTCHADLQKIFNVAIKRSKIDFGISEGHRTIERQKYLYSIGRTIRINSPIITHVDGEKKKSKHNSKPSFALDIFIYTHQNAYKEKILYDKPHLAYIAGLIDSIAAELLEAGEISHAIRWGGNWDSDGVIDLDQRFDDYPHFELIKPTK